MKFQRIILVEVLNRREREVNGSALFQVVAALLGLSLIGASIYISTHASAPPRRAARAPAPPVEPSEFAADPEPAPDPAPQPISHPDSVPSLGSLEEWLDLARGRLSRFPSGTPEYEQFRRSLMSLLRSHPAGVESSVRLLLEDSALEPAARAMMVDDLGRLDDPERAETVLLGLIRNPAANDALRCDAMTSLAALPRGSIAGVRELILVAGTSGAPGHAAVEALGALYRKSPELSETQRQAMVTCVTTLHAKGMADLDIELLASGLKALARMGLRRDPDPFRTALAHANADVRQAGIEASSALPPGARRDLLIPTLASEKNLDLRLQALNALPLPFESHDPVVEAVATRAREDGDEHLRRAALEFFARSYDSKRRPPPAVEAVIRDRRQNDSSSVNREYAEWLQERLGIK